MQFLTKLLAIPIDQGAPGDVEPLGEAAQAPALGSEFEELAFGVGVIHNGARFRQSVIVRPGSRTRRIALVLGRGAVAGGATCTDAHVGTVELHGCAKLFRDFC